MLLSAIEFLLLSAALDISTKTVCKSAYLMEILLF